jgi:hypothetical protein
VEAYLLELSLCLFLVGLFTLVHGVGWRWGKKVKVTEEERLEAAKAKREMEEMMAMPGWKRLEQIASVQVESRSNQVLLSPTESPLTQEYLKGEVNGIRSFVKIPGVVVEEAKRIIALANEEGV